MLWLNLSNDWSISLMVTCVPLHRNSVWIKTVVRVSVAQCITRLTTDQKTGVQTLRFSTNLNPWFKEFLLDKYLCLPSWMRCIRPHCRVSQSSRNILLPTFFAGWNCRWRHLALSGEGTDHLSTHSVKTRDLITTQNSRYCKTAVVS